MKCCKQVAKLNHLIICGLFCSVSLLAQHRPADYPFIDTTFNQLSPDQALQPFLRKLQELQQHQRQQVRIAHLGDSHVQADYLSSALRQLFQDRFGNAGRGLVFFYQQAGTHGPLDLQTQSSQQWRARRRIFQKNGLSIGISGMSIATTAPRFSLWLSAQQKARPLRISKATLFHDEYKNYDYSWEVLPPQNIPLQGNWEYYQVQIDDTLLKISQQYGCSPTDIQRWNNLSTAVVFPGQRLTIQNPQHKAPQSQPFLPTAHPQASIALLPDDSPNLHIRGQKRKGTGHAQIYGLLLEDENTSGVLYNMMGVNGATFYHFNHAEYFTEQIALLQPDLILITLGTNESLQPRFYPEQFRKEVSELLQKLKASQPQSSLLLMGNPSVLTSPDTTEGYTLAVRTILQEVAQEEGAVFWDWYAIMGGQESIRNWHAAQLASPDFIHFTEKGYILQARLLFDAIMKAYRAAY